MQEPLLALPRCKRKGHGRMAVLGMKTQTSSGSLNRRSFDLARLAHPSAQDATLLRFAEYSDIPIGFVITSAARDLLLRGHGKSRSLAPNQIGRASCREGG